MRFEVKLSSESLFKSFLRVVEENRYNVRKVLYVDGTWKSKVIGVYPYFLSLVIEESNITQGSRRYPVYEIDKPKSENLKYKSFCR